MKEKFFKGRGACVNMGDPDAIEAQLIELGHEQYMDEGPDCKKFAGLSLKLMAPAFAELMRRNDIDPQHKVHAICSAAALFCSMVVGSSCPEDFLAQAIKDTKEYFGEPFEQMVYKSVEQTKRARKSGALNLFKDDAPIDEQAQSLIDDVFKVGRGDKNKLH